MLGTVLAGMALCCEAACGSKAELYSISSPHPLKQAVDLYDKVYFALLVSKYKCKKAGAKKAARSNCVHCTRK